MCCSVVDEYVDLRRQRCMVDDGEIPIPAVYGPNGVLDDTAYDRYHVAVNARLVELKLSMTAEEIQEANAIYERWFKEYLAE
jgi:hypothetical protein